MKPTVFATISRLGQAASEAISADARWKWDERFQAALTVLSTTDAAALYLALSEISEDWTSDSVGTCPEPVGYLVDELGGLREGQHLFSAMMSPGSLTYIASWPWRDGAHVSVRFGTYDVDPEPTEAALVRLTIMRGMGIEP